MKKIISFLAIFTLFICCGCNKEMYNTPNKRVEMFLENYQSLDDEVLTQLDDTLANEDMTEEQKERYKDIMKKHYQNLTYEIKDEVVDGDTATVTAEIEVTDYTKVMNDADTYLDENEAEFNNDEGVYDESLFNDYRLDQFETAKDTVKYTIDFTLTKVDDEWQLDDITDIDEQKIHGMYNY